MAERTGCPVLFSLWSCVRVVAMFMLINSTKKLFAVLTQTALIWCVYPSHKKRARDDPTCLHFTTTSIIASVFERLVDVLGVCFFPREGQLGHLEWLGRSIAAFMPDDLSMWGERGSDAISGRVAG
jgi:hypothetical protein